MTVVDKLREKKSRDNRELLDLAAYTIDRLAGALAQERCPIPWERCPIPWKRRDSAIYCNDCWLRAIEKEFYASRGENKTDR